MPYRVFGKTDSCNKQLKLMNSSQVPMKCHTTVNSSVLYSSSGLSLSWRARIEYAVSFGRTYTLLDCKIQYAVLGRRFDTSYPTGGYDVLA
nr:hypothetical protein [Tanacetum cinerariifolium]